MLILHRVISFWSHILIEEKTNLNWEHSSLLEICASLSILWPQFFFISIRIMTSFVRIGWNDNSKLLFPWKTTWPWIAFIIFYVLFFQAKSGVRIEDNKRASIIKFKSSSRFGAKVANGSCFRKPNTRIGEMCQPE